MPPRAASDCARRCSPTSTSSARSGDPGTAVHHAVGAGPARRRGPLSRLPALHHRGRRGVSVGRLRHPARLPESARLGRAEADRSPAEGTGLRPHLRSLAGADGISRPRRASLLARRQERERARADPLSQRRLRRGRTPSRVRTAPAGLMIVMSLLERVLALVEARERTPTAEPGGDPRCSRR